MTSESSNSAEPIVAPFSLSALLIGAVLSMVISGALVIATAKAGISPGVSPLVVLIGWVVFGGLGIATVFTLVLIPVIYSILAPLAAPRAHAGVRLDRELREIEHPAAIVPAKAAE